MVLPNHDLPVRPHTQTLVRGENSSGVWSHTTCTGSQAIAFTTVLQDRVRPSPLKTGVATLMRVL